MNQLMSQAGHEYDARHIFLAPKINQPVGQRHIVNSLFV
jgi:hypothetical protein